MRSRFVRFRNLLVLFVSRHSTLNEIVREVYLQTRENGLWGIISTQYLVAYFEAVKNPYHHQLSQ